MPRRVLIAVALVLLLPVLAVAALIGLAQTAWGERWVEARASAALHRPVSIDGISFRWGWPPGVVLAHLRIGNPDWAKSRDLVDAEGLYARVAVPPLFAGKVVLPYLGARKAVAGLELDGDRATWRFGSDSKNPSPLVLTKVYLDDGHIAYREEAERTQLEVDVKGSAGQSGMLEASATGSFRGEPAKVRARIPKLATQHAAPIFVDGSGTVGRTQATVQGQFEADGGTLDMTLKVAGQNLKDLAKLTGMVLPDSPPYHLGGHLRHEQQRWIFDPFDGRMGDSDIEGALTYEKGRERPLLSAVVRAKLLDFNDLGPLIGAPPGTGAGETAAPEQQAQAAQREAEQRVLPEIPFSTAAWAKMDADVKLDARRVLRPKQLPIDSLSTHLVMTDAVLKLKPLRFGFAEGRIDSEVTIDGRRKPAHAQLKADVQGVHLAPLFPTAKSMQEALGTLYGHAELAGDGDSVRAMLGTSSGKAAVAVGGGHVSALLVALLKLDVAELVMLLGVHHRQVNLNCGVGSFEVRNGVGSTDPFVIDTQDTLVDVKGSVSLRDEAYDLETISHPKDNSLLSLRSPITIQGPMRKPKVRPKAGPIAARVAGAVALGAASPALALVALMDKGSKAGADCDRLLAQAREKGAVKKAAND